MSMKNALPVRTGGPIVYRYTINHFAIFVNLFFVEVELSPVIVPIILL